MTIWKQPTIKNNGEWGVDGLAVKSSDGSADAYKAFDGTDSYFNGFNTDVWLEMYFSPNPLAIADVYIASSDGYLPASGKMQYSDDNSSWTDAASWTCSDGSRSAYIHVPKTETAGHRFWRLYSTSRSADHPNNNADHPNNNADISCVKLYAAENEYPAAIENLYNLHMQAEYINPDKEDMTEPRMAATYTQTGARMQISEPLLFMSYFFQDFQPTIETLYADTRRKVIGEYYETVSADTAIIHAVHDDINADTGREVFAGYHERINADTRKTVDYVESINDDTRLRISITENVLGDTCRKIIYRETMNNDTCRHIFNIESNDSDTARKIPHEIIIPVEPQKPVIPADPVHMQAQQQAPGIVSYTITLAEKTLSDVVTLETTKFMNVKDAITGTILDYAVNMQVESTSQEDITQTVKSMYCVDKLLYTPFNYQFAAADYQGANKSLTAKAHAKKIGAGLGLDAVLMFDDFIPSSNFSGKNATYQSILSGIFGWTDKLPRRQINIFIFGQRLYFMQRGNEPNVIDITEIPHSRPKVDREIVRTCWNVAEGNSKKKSTDINIIEPKDPKRANKTISGGGSKATYGGGLLLSDEDLYSKTTYSYNSSDELIKKETKSNDGSKHSITEYEYASMGTSDYCCYENERIYEDGELETHNETFKSKGECFEVVKVYRDGDLVQSNTHRYSAPSTNSAPTDYEKKESDKDLQKPEECYTFDNKTPNGSSTTSDTNFTIAPYDTAYLNGLYSEIEWMDRKVQETLEVDIISQVINGAPAYSHIINFFDRVKLDGNEYFLVKNDVKQTTKKFKQSIKIVRWF